MQIHAPPSEVWPRFGLSLRRRVPVRRLMDLPATVAAGLLIGQ
jgi:hypothetical protein